MDRLPACEVQPGMEHPVYGEILRVVKLGTAGVRFDTLRGPALYGKDDTVFVVGKKS